MTAISCSVSAADVTAVKQQAGLFDASDYGVLSVQGPDAVVFLQNLTTNDVKALPVGRLQWSALLDRKGRVQSLFSILRAAEDRFLLLVQADLKDATAEHLNKMRFIQRVTIGDDSERWAYLWVVGPEAIDRVGEAVGVHGDMLAASQKILIPPDRASWHLWRHERWSVPCVALLLPLNERAEALSLLAASEVPGVAKSAVDLVRLEAGVPEFGLEIDATRILLEGGLADTFSRAKGCYPGQEVIERICAYGEGKTPYKLKIIKVKGKVVLDDKIPVISQGEAVGEVVRGLYNPTSDESLLAAYVATKIAEVPATAVIQEGSLQL